MKQGLREFLGSGIRFFTSNVAAVYVGLKLATDPASSFYINLLTSLPSSGTEALTIDASGNMGRQALGGGGTVTSFSSGSLSPLFSASVANPNTTPALSFALTTQTANTVFAGPASGGLATPTFRSLVVADIPTLTASKISDFDSQVRTSRLDQFAAPTGPVNFNSQKATGLADGTNAQDAATWGQTQALFNGTDNKASVRAATTANLTLSGTQTIDGVSLLAGDRVLVKNQATASANGVYLVASGSWTRATDADISAEVTSGLFVFVEEGTGNGSNGYTLTTPNPITLGTTNLTFTQTSGAGQIIAGAGLTKTGNTLDVVGTLNRLLVNADSIDIDAAYVGQTSITTLGTIATGTWQGTTIAVAKGGTGGTTAATARSNLSAAGVYRQSFTNTDLTSGVLTITHNLGNKIVNVQISDNADQVIMPDNIVLSNTTQCGVDLTSFGSITGTYNAIVTG